MPTVTSFLSARDRRRYERDPWSTMSGRWPKLDNLGHDREVVHWNDGHYGVIIFPAITTDVQRQDFLRYHLPGWCIHVEHKLATVFRTTNSLWGVTAPTAAEVCDRHDAAYAPQRRHTPQEQAKALETAALVCESRGAPATAKVLRDMATEMLLPAAQVG